MKIAVIGATGVIGRATADFFDYNYSRRKEEEVVRYSRAIEAAGQVTKDEVNSCDIAFICVPTPMFKDKFGVDLSAVHEVFSWLKVPITVLKSTVPPGTTEDIASELDVCVIHNPEFLTEQNAYADMLEADHVLLGYPNEIYAEEAQKVRQLYEECYGSEVKIFVVPSRVTEMVKYMRNNYLATKVIWCNEMYDICQRMGIDWNMAKELWLLDKRITRSHTIVTKERGYSGMCFPKDVKGLIGFGNSELMRKVHEINGRIRK